MTFRRFEDIVAWQTARAVARAIYAVSRKPAFRRDFSLRDQIRRSAVSLMANIAEGFTRRYDREFVQFLFVAKSSAAEIQSHLYVALDQEYTDQQEFLALYQQTQQCERQLSGLITYLLGRKPRGSRS